MCSVQMKTKCIGSQKHRASTDRQDRKTSTLISRSVSRCPMQAYKGAIRKARWEGRPSAGPGHNTIVEAYESFPGHKDDEYKRNDLTFM